MKNSMENLKIILGLILCFLAIMVLCFIENYNAIQADGLAHIVDIVPKTVFIPQFIMVLISGFWKIGSKHNETAAQSNDCKN